MKLFKPLYTTCYCVAVLPVGRFSRTIGLLSRCVAGNSLLLRVAFFFGLVLSKFMRFFGLFLLNVFLSKSIVFVDFAGVVGFVLT